MNSVGTPLALPRPLNKPPRNVGGFRSVRPGRRFGQWTIQANAIDVNGQPYVTAVSEDIAYPGGVFSETVLGRYLCVWAAEWGTVTLRSPDGDEVALEAGWYPWPDDDGDNEPIQGVLL